MAPKKNDENSAKKPLPRKRVVKPKPEKPKLKTPTIIKVKIPLKPLRPNDDSSKLTKKQLTVQKKLELANEVALAQLYNNTTAEGTPAQAVQECAVPKVPSAVKRKRKPSVVLKEAPKKQKRNSKTCIGETGSGPGNETEAVIEVETPKRRIRKPAAKKCPAENPDATITKLGKPKLNRKRITKVAATTTNIDETTPKTEELVIKKETDSNSETNDIKPDTETLTVTADPKCNVVPNRVTTRSLRKRNIQSKAAVQNVAKQGPPATETVNGGRAAGSRAGSVNSAGSGLSWTHDISASSTTTCVTVTSSDLVRMDGKLPVVQVVDIGEQPPRVESSSSSSSSLSSSSSSSSRASSPPRAPPLDLSASSSVASSPRGRSSPVDLGQMTAALDRLATSLRSLDPPTVQRAPRPPPALYDALKEESAVIALCRDLQRILAPAPVEFVRPATPRARVSVAAPDRASNDFASDRVRCTTFDQSADDDDALSLFAESITGLESSRTSGGSAPARAEEYVPAAAARAPEPRRYRPTRILPPPAAARAPVCEKHSADSTSVRDAAARDEDPPAAWERLDRTPAELPTPTLRATSLNDVQPMLPSRSALFRGVCFYNLSGGCKFVACRFPHATLGDSEVRRRAAALPDAVLLRECALVRSHAALRARMSLLIVEELARRGLARAVVDACAGLPSGTAETQAALEMALQVLGRAEWIPALEAAVGALLQPLLRALADTQNLSRFRTVLVRIARVAASRVVTIPADVAERIVERVSILPADESLAVATLTLAERSDPSVLLSPAAAALEGRLPPPAREELHRRRSRAACGPPAPDREERYTSPDTTHYDTMKTLPISPMPMITRIVDVKRARTTVTFDPSIPPPYLTKPYNNWRKRGYGGRRPLRRPNGVRPVHSPVGTASDNMRTVQRRPVAATYTIPSNNYQPMAGSDFYDFEA